MGAIRNKPDPHEDEGSPHWLLRQLTACDRDGAWYVSDGEGSYLRLPRRAWAKLRAQIGGVAQGLKRKRTVGA